MLPKMKQTCKLVLSATSCRMDLLIAIYVYARSNILKVFWLIAMFIASFNQSSLIARLKATALELPECTRIFDSDTESDASGVSCCR